MMHCSLHGWAFFQFLLVMLACLPTVAGAQITFSDVTDSAGIDHQYQVYEGLFGGGVCVFDYDGDGFQDLFLASGMGEDVLYHNQGDGTFRNAYAGSGLELTRHYICQGGVSADVNRDGWVDLFVTTITTADSVKVIPREKNLLFLNNGDGTFRDATEAFGLDQMFSFSTAANFGDVNADGYPDLFVGNYFQNYDGQLDTIYDATIVSSTKTAEDYLLINRRGKRLENMARDYGLEYRGFGFGGVFTDFDRDSDQDLIVMNDFGFKNTPNLLFENRYPSRIFREIGEATAMDLKINSMGTAVGDVNADGKLDYFLTNIRFPSLMIQGEAGEPFLDQAVEQRMVYNLISWGANLADFDLDGDVDLFVAHGDLNPNCVPMVNQYFENEGGRFTERGMAVGLNHYGIGRGSATFDLENDGDLDILVVNQAPVLLYPENIESVTKLYRNDQPGGNWLQVALRGRQAESQGIGSRVEVVAGGRRMLREIDGGSSHNSQNAKLAHFGLGAATRVDSIVVTWLGGKEQVLTDQPANALITVEEMPDPPSYTWIWLGGLSLMAGLFAFLYFRNR